MSVSFLKVRGAAGARGPRGQQVRRRGVEPEIGALSAHPLDDPLQNLRGEEHRAALPAVKGHDGHAPGPLAGDAPVRAPLHHLVDALPAPAGNPGDPVDGRQGLAPKVVGRHGDEPLLRGPEDDGLLAAPAVRVAVGHLLPARSNLPFCAQEFNDARVGLPHLLAGKLRNFFGEPAAVVHRRIGLKTVTAAVVIVLLAVPRGDVHQPGARLQGDVVRQDDLGVPFQPGMAADGALQGASLDPKNLLPLEPPRASTAPRPDPRPPPGPPHPRPSRHIPGPDALRWRGWPARSRGWWSR